MTIFAEKTQIAKCSDARTLLNEIEQRLDHLLPVEGERNAVINAMREGALAPGKRIRPLLLIMAARDLGYVCDHYVLLDLACAIEIVHAASLILDDIPCMDNAKMRRGRPTVHCQFGEPVAILAAVALLSRAFEVIATAHNLSAQARNQAVAELSRAIGVQGLVQGQFRDLAEGSHSRSVDAVLLTNQFKTSALFSASMQIAAIVASASADSRDKLQDFSLELGQAFQLLDDLMDSQSNTGKDINQDAGKSTLVNMLGRRVVEQQLREHLKRADLHLTSACPSGMSTRQFIQSWFDKKIAAAS